MPIQYFLILLWLVQEISQDLDANVYRIFKNILKHIFLKYRFSFIKNRLTVAQVPSHYLEAFLNDKYPEITFKNATFCALVISPYHTQMCKEQIFGLIMY